MFALLFFPFIFVTGLSKSHSVSGVTFAVVFIGTMAFTLGVTALLFSRRYVITNRRIVDCGAVVGPAWMLPFAEIESIAPFYVDGSSGGTSSVDFRLRAVELIPRSGESHRISLGAHSALVRLELVRAELRSPFPERVKSDAHGRMKAHFRDKPKPPPS
jgi:hypothetical protein